MYNAHTAIGSLPVTGIALSTGHNIVAAATLIFFGIAMLRLIPKREA